MFSSLPMRREVSNVHGERTSASIQLLQSIQILLPTLSEQDRILEKVVPSQALLHALNSELRAMELVHQALLTSLLFGATQEQTQ
jgi:restriction endonuclease S subunit